MCDLQLILGIYLETSVLSHCWGFFLPYPRPSLHSHSLNGRVMGGRAPPQDVLSLEVKKEGFKGPPETNSLSVSNIQSLKLTGGLNTPAPPQAQCSPVCVVSVVMCVYIKHSKCVRLCVCACMGA